MIYKEFPLIIKKPTFKEKIRLLFRKEKHTFGEKGISYFYKEMDGNIYITREIIPDAYYLFESDGTKTYLTKENIKKGDKK